jgi:hypothetical protein
MMTEHDDFYADDALPYPYRDDGPGGVQRGECEHSGTARLPSGGCPNGCSGATEHYSNDGHRACEDVAVDKTGKRVG